MRLTLTYKNTASFEEKLLISNGLNINPLNPDARGLKEVMTGIYNDRDLNEYLLGQHKQLPPRQGEPKYERNPVRILPIHPRDALLSPAQKLTLVTPIDIGP